jgi:hypothetical protein
VSYAMIPQRCFLDTGHLGHVHERQSGVKIGEVELHASGDGIRRLRKVSHYSLLNNSESLEI